MGNTHSSQNKEKKAGDVTFSVADEEQNVQTFSINERLLFSHSSVFKNLAKSGVIKRNKVIQLNNITCLGLQKILQFLETGEIVFESCREAQETLKTALEYHIENAKDVCLEYLCTALDTSNVCQIYEFAETSDLPELAYACLRIIDKEINTVLERPEFANLKLSTVVSIIGRSNLAVRSEFSLVHGIINWGKHELERREIDDRQTQIFMEIIRPALDNLRMGSMSMRKRSDPVYIGVYKYIAAKRFQSSSGQTIQRSFPRHYCEYHVHPLEILDRPQTALFPGDQFHLTGQVLKGRVFLYGVSLALKVLSSCSASAASLYVVLTATNASTGDKKVVRDTFFNANEHSLLKLKTPLTVKENESFHLELRVKLTGKVSPLARKNEVEIIFPSPMQDIAMKIFSQKSTQKVVKCIFRELLYYF